MSNSNSSGGCALIGILLPLVMIGLPIWVGFKTYEWIHPKDFWGILKFLFAWSVFGAIADMIAMALLGFVASLFED